MAHRTGASPGDDSSCDDNSGGDSFCDDNSGGDSSGHDCTGDDRDGGDSDGGDALRTRISGIALSSDDRDGDDSDVGDSADDEEIRYVYWVLTKNEYAKWKKGYSLTAKDPNADISVEKHVLEGSQCGLKSQYISTCRSQSAAELFASESRSEAKNLVRIDLQKAGNGHLTIIDISTRAKVKKRINCKAYKKCSKETQKAIDNAVKFEEVLLVGEIPADCIMLVQVYRVLTRKETSEWGAYGLKAKDPDAEMSVKRHVLRGKEKSQYISTSRTITGATQFAFKDLNKPTTTVKIDLEKAKQINNDLKIIDISTKKNATKYFDMETYEDEETYENETERAADLAKFLDYTVRSQEVLLVGHIPANCISLYQPEIDSSDKNCSISSKDKK